MKIKIHDTGLLKELLKEIKIIDKRLRKVERIVPVERLTKEESDEIKKSEEQIKKGNYRTIGQVKKELGIE